MGSRAVSINLAAVEKARTIFGGALADKIVLLVGAGEMAEQAAKHLAGKEARKILICNRTTGNAVRLAAEINGESADFESLETILPEADMVICSTNASDFLISKETALQSQERRQYRPALFIDISVPRNVSPDVGEIDNVFLYDIDDLQSVISANSEARRREAASAESIIIEEAAEFWKYLPILDKGETLGLVRQKMHDAARSEFKRYRPRFGDLTPEQETAIEQLMLSAVNKIAQPILYGLRRLPEAGASEFADILCSMLGASDNERFSERG